MKTALTLLATIGTFLMPIKGLIILLVCFITFDTLMAIYVSVKMKGWKSFRSALLRKGMTSKIFLYLGTVVIAFMADQFIMGGATFGIKYLLSKGLAAVWCYAEIKSCDENSIKLGNRSFFVILKEFFQKITGYKDEIKKIVE